MESQTTTRRLVRRRDDRMIAGVCGGVADHFGIDVTLVRVLTVAFTIFGGAGLLLYVVAWAMIPEEGQDHGFADSWVRRGRWHPIVGLVFIFVAISSISDHFWHIGDFGFPFFLVVLGAFLLWYRPPTNAPFRDTAPVAAPASAPPVGGAEALAGDEEAPRRGGRRGRDPASRDEFWALQEERRRRHRERRGLTRLTVAVLAIGAGIAGIAVAAGASLDATRVLGAGVLIVGLALIVGTRYGYGSGVVFLGILLMLALTAVSMVKVPFSGGIGDRTYAPASVSELKPEYHLAIGEMRLDLSSIRPSTGTTSSVVATVGIGHLLLTVPPDVEVVLHGQASLGDVQVGRGGVDDGHDGGWKVERDEVLHPGAEGAGKIEVDAQVGIGQVEVRNAGS